MTWLSKPWYVRPDSVTVQSTIRGFPISIVEPALTIESVLQGLLSGKLDDCQFWLNPAHNTFLTARNEQAIINDFVWTALQRLQWFPGLTTDGEDPIALGTQYARQMISIMQQINSGGVGGGTDGVSLWDAWTAMTDPVK
jgi:hypothetical protein